MTALLKRERQALVAHWIDEAHVRHVPGAVTDAFGLYNAFCQHVGAMGEAVQTNEFAAALRKALGRNLATVWQGRPHHMAVLADNVASYQTGDDFDLLPDFDPAPPTAAERSVWNWPHLRLRAAVEQEIAAGRQLAIGACSHWLMGYDGNAWRPAADTPLRAAFARCFDLFGIETMGQSAYQMALDAVMKDLAVPFLMLARNAAVTVERSGRLCAYRVQPGTGSPQDRWIDWAEVDDAGTYRPVAQRGEAHVLDALLSDVSFHDQEVLYDMLRDQAHVRAEARELRQAAAEIEVETASPRRKRL
ncbi:hypothetical protein C7401_102278 [Paraburkholderia unamae]|uniref:hypothetical protein n=1 Tax=Paraburkholderia unamae TaxID=219649 RepID=UPI000DC24C00|nr:hypothetical protein [Paraburkholderia unamae]RAR66853.1 hypothetical protein C7401_102278 [Paraburkholderia unamae]